MWKDADFQSVCSRPVVEEKRLCYGEKCEVQFLGSYVEMQLGTFPVRNWCGLHRLHRLHRWGQREGLKEAEEGENGRLEDIDYK